MYLDIKRAVFLTTLITLYTIVTSAKNSDKNYCTTDTIVKPNTAKHYIRPCLYLNTYNTPEKKIKNKRLESYKFAQSNIGFYVPLFTHTYFSSDSLTIPTFHLLAIGNLLTAKPYFGGFKNQYVFYKLAGGLRAIYSNGKKNTWFFNACPFVSQDNRTISKPTWRYVSIIVFNKTVSPKFSYRIGIIKTFLFGRGVLLPIAGLRFGPLDGTYINIQFPRNISLNFPMSRNLSGGVFVKPFGGIYNFSNADTTFKKKGSILQFGRYEFLGGFSLSYFPSRNFSLDLSTGITKSRKISWADNSKRDGSKYPFFSSEIDPALFINIGLTFKFGEAKKAYNNSVMYDIFELNNSLDPGDNNDRTSNSDIPVKSNLKDIKKIQYKDIEDLLNVEDLY